MFSFLTTGVIKKSLKNIDASQSHWCSSSFEPDVVLCSVFVTPL